MADDAGLFPHLFSPLAIRGMVVRNRIYSSPHTALLVRTVEGAVLPDEREAAYQEEKARGGCGFQMLGAQLVHPASASARKMPSAFDDRIIPAYRAVAEAVHRHDGRIGVQLSFFGAAGDPGTGGTELRAPSDVATDIHKETPHAMSLEELDELREAFGRAAGRVRAAGMDAVLLHAGHGFFLNQMLSPVFNKRADKYGGSLERRAQYLVDVLRTVRAAVGDDFPIGVRLSVAEFLEGGMTAEDSGQVAHLLDLQGLVDWFDCSWGSDTNWASQSYHYASSYIPHGPQVDLAAAIRAVVSKPVAAVGRVVDPAMAERIVASGKADLVAMTRAQIADPHLANKARAGRLASIRPCVGANEGCLGRVYEGLGVGCVWRASAGREGEWADVPRAAAQRRVVVIGGGPAGLEAARVAALRGHKVALYERGDRLGGQLLLAAALPGRAEFGRIPTWLEREVRELGVEVHTGTALGAADVRALAPDAVVVATGSQPRAAAFPGGAGRVLEPRAVVAGAPVGEGVLLLDGEAHVAGLGAADLLAAQGKRVTVLVKDYVPGQRIDIDTRPQLLKRLFERGVRFEIFTWLRRLEGRRAIVYNTLTGQEWAIDGVDTVVAALGGVADDGLVGELKGFLPDVHAVGDCRAPRRLIDAIRGAFATAFDL